MASEPSPPPHLNEFSSEFHRIRCQQRSNLLYQQPERATLISIGQGWLNGSTACICSKSSAVGNKRLLIQSQNRKLRSGIAFCSRGCQQQLFPFLSLILAFSLLLSLISYLLVLFLLPSASLLSVLLVLLLGLVLGPGLWMSASMVVLPLKSQSFKCQKLHY